MTQQALQVVIMRPQHQAQALVDYVVDQKGKAIVLPMIDIVPIPIESKAFNALQTADLVIVSSQNAVWFAPSRVIDILRQFQHKRVITMGQATSKALNEKGVDILLTAPRGSQSEDLLESDVLQSDSVSEQSVVILGCQGGRETIAQTLKARGAVVTFIEIYKQEPIAYNFDALFEKWSKDEAQTCFVSTSLNILDNLLSQTPEKYMDWLRSQPLVVVSDRIELFAKQQGFQTIIHAKGADIHSLQAALEQNF